jgi:hypothetical protein
MHAVSVETLKFTYGKNNQDVLFTGSSASTVTTLFPLITCGK